MIATENVTADASAPPHGAGLSLGKVVLFWAAYLAILIAASPLKGSVPERWGQLVWGTSSASAILLLTLLFLSRERRSIREVGLNLEAASVSRFVAGALMGLTIYGLNVLLVTALTSPIQFTRTGVDAGAVLLAVATFIVLSMMEELGFRGYSLRTLVPGIGLWKAQGVVALAFGLSHLAFGWSWVTVLVGVLPNALLFGMSAVVSRGLALPIGLHAGINVARWAAGEKGTPGIWTMSASDQTSGQISAVAPVVGVAIPLLVSFVMWRWYQVHLKRASATEG